MVAIHPVVVALVNAEWIDSVPAPAYDALSVADRQAFRLAHPLSYLNVTRAPEDEPDSTTVTNDELIARGRVTLDRLLAEGAFDFVDTPRFFLYRLIDGDHKQTALVCDVPVEAYERAEIRIHEQIRAVRAELLAEHLVGVGHSSSPIALTVRSSDHLSALYATAREATPVIDFVAPDGLQQTVWTIDDDALAANLIEALADSEAIIIDGHHRAAAAQVVAAKTGGAGATGRMLAAIFLDVDLRMGSFHRWVPDVSGDAAAAVVAELKNRYEVVDEAGSFLPERGELGVCVADGWYRVRLAASVDPSDPHERLSSLDPVVLQRDILAALMGIDDPGSDPRLRNLADISVDALNDVVEADGGIAFAVAPLQMDDLLVVAGAGLTMPPKSTYFTPKVRSGLFLRPQA